MGHFKSLSAVFPIILRMQNGHTQVLLHQRQNTGYMDGKWDFAGSGHVEEGETASEAVARECSEEIGIVVRAQDTKFVHLCHRVGGQGTRTYYDLYFIIQRFDGLPRIAEPDKCSALQWFDTTSLPEEMIELRRQALQHSLSGRFYSEIHMDA